MQKLLTEVRACTLCSQHLPLSPRPVLSVSPQSRVLIIGQAPGTKVHETGVPWNDASGKELRRWMNVSDEQFYDNKIFGIMPMGFCYPGKGTRSDLPPRPECAVTWHEKLLKQLVKVELILLIGQYAQFYYLGAKFKSLTENVRNYGQFAPRYFPLVHPSPRNKIWQKKNPWFEKEVVPALRKRIAPFL